MLAKVTVPSLCVIIAACYMLKQQVIEILINIQMFIIPSLYGAFGFESHTQGRSLLLVKDYHYVRATFIDECSGITSLLALLYYAIILAVTNNGALKVALAVIPFAILANTFRILLIHAGAYYKGHAFAYGLGGAISPYHEACFYVSLILTTLILYKLS